MYTERVAKGMDQLKEVLDYLKTGGGTNAAIDRGLSDIKDALKKIQNGATMFSRNYRCEPDVHRDERSRVTERMKTYVVGHCADLKEEVEIIKDIVLSAQDKFIDYGYAMEHLHNIVGDLGKPGVDIEAVLKEVSQKFGELEYKAEMVDKSFCALNKHLLKDNDGVKRIEGIVVVLDSYADDAMNPEHYESRLKDMRENGIDEAVRKNVELDTAYTSFNEVHGEYRTKINKIIQAIQEGIAAEKKRAGFQAIQNEMRHVYTGRPRR